MKIEIKKPNEEDLEREGVSSWPIWEKEISGKGDFVTFPKGLSCIWDIKEPVKKHYNFR
jgi:hypothetical protein